MRLNLPVSWKRLKAARTIRWHKTQKQIIITQILKHLNKTWNPSKLGLLKQYKNSALTSCCFSATGIHSSLSRDVFSCKSTTKILISEHTWVVFERHLLQHAENITHDSRTHQARTCDGIQRLSDVVLCVFLPTWQPKQRITITGELVPSTAQGHLRTKHKFNIL